MHLARPRRIDLHVKVRTREKWKSLSLSLSRKKLISRRPFFIGAENFAKNRTVTGAFKASPANERDYRASNFAAVSKGNNTSLLINFKCPSLALMKLSFDFITEKFNIEN